MIQKPDRFCFGIDATLLAWFMKVKPGERVLDLCTGTGVVMFLADARNPGGSYVGLEIQCDMAEMAARSVKLNQAEDRIRIVEGDVRNASRLFKKGSFDVVSVNPPYMKAGNGLKNPNEAKAIARHEILCTLDDVLRESYLVLKPRGRFYMVHRPERLTEILAKMSAYKLTPAELIMVHPYRDRGASMVLISGTKGGRNMLRCLPPIVIYREKFTYTEELLRIYTE